MASSALYAFLYHIILRLQLIRLTYVRYTKCLSRTTTRAAIGKIQKQIEILFEWYGTDPGVLRVHNTFCGELVPLFYIFSFIATRTAAGILLYIFIFDKYQIGTFSGVVIFC